MWGFVLLGYIINTTVLWHLQIDSPNGQNYACAWQSCHQIGWCTLPVCTCICQCPTIYCTTFTIQLKQYQALITITIAISTFTKLNKKIAISIQIIPISISISIGIVYIISYLIISLLVNAYSHGHRCHSINQSQNPIESVHNQTRLQLCQPCHPIEQEN